MSKTSTLTQFYTLTGDGDSISNSVVNSNSASAAPSLLTVAAGDNSIVIPAGLTLTSVTVKPPSGSSNAKSIKAVAGDSNPGGWTSQTVTYPIAGLSGFVVHSAGSETLEAWWN